jgi:hypothetical protein
MINQVVRSGTKCIYLSGGMTWRARRTTRKSPCSYEKEKERSEQKKIKRKKEKMGSRPIEAKSGKGSGC